LTFKDLKKRVCLEIITQQQSRLSEILKDKPFWIWGKQQHKQQDIKTDGYCCFNRIIGLPQKDGIDKPLYDYENIIFDLLIAHDGSANNKHLWIKKATGLGVSEFMLRFMAWLCLKDNALAGSQMCIVAGPRIDLAIALIDRMKRLFAGGVQTEWRRDKVQELCSKGYSQREISHTLQVGLATVNRDISYLRNQAKINIRKYNQMLDTILFIPLQKR
jgi:hypothetical protein